MLLSCLKSILSWTSKVYSCVPINASNNLFLILKHIKHKNNYTTSFSPHNSQTHTKHLHHALSIPISCARCRCSPTHCSGCSPGLEQLGSQGGVLCSSQRAMGTMVFCCSCDDYHDYHDDPSSKANYYHDSSSSVARVDHHHHYNQELDRCKPGSVNDHSS